MAVDGVVSARPGPLLLADISGYTRFMQAVARAHGEEMARSGEVPPAYPLMATLLDGIIEALVPPFVLSKTEGDAVFAFASLDDLRVRGQELLEIVDSCYRAFAAQIAALEAALTCDCSACSSGVALDLKFVFHVGTYVIQPVAGRPELLGPDVNVVHRLLKNNASEIVGGGAYALFTAAAAFRLGLPLERAASMTETYDHLETIELYVYRLPLSLG